MPNEAPSFTNVYTSGHQQVGESPGGQIEMGYTIPKTRPPEGYMPKEFDTKKFEETVFKQLGGNPFDISISGEVSKSNQNIPALFRHVFRGKLTWAQRGKMNTHQANFWKQVLDKYRVDTTNAAIRTRATKIDKYNNMMGKFNEEKQEFDAKLSKYEDSMAKRELVDRSQKVWIHNRKDGIKRFVHPIVAEGILRNDPDFVLGQPMAKEKPAKEEKIYVFNPTEKIRRHVTKEEAEDLLRLTDWDTNEPLWKLGTPYGREERAERTKDPTPAQAIRRVTALRKELESLEEDDGSGFISDALMQNKDAAMADIEASLETYKEQLKTEIDYMNQFVQEDYIPTPVEPVEDPSYAPPDIPIEKESFAERTVGNYPGYKVGKFIYKNVKGLFVDGKKVEFTGKTATCPETGEAIGLAVNGKWYTEDGKEVD